MRVLDSKATKATDGWPVLAVFFCVGLPPRSLSLPLSLEPWRCASNEGSFLCCCARLGSKGWIEPRGGTRGGGGSLSSPYFSHSILFSTLLSSFFSSFTFNTHAGNEWKNPRFGNVSNRAKRSFGEPTLRRSTLSHSLFHPTLYSLSLSLFVEIFHDTAATVSIKCVRTDGCGEFF